METSGNSKCLLGTRSFLVSGNSRTEANQLTLVTLQRSNVSHREPPARAEPRPHHAHLVSCAAAAWIFLRQHSRAKHEGVCGLGGVAFGAGRGRWLRRDVSHYKKQARGRCLPSGRGLSGRLWGALGCSGATRDRSGPLGTARDRSGPLGTARGRSGRLGTARDPRDRSGPLGTTRDRSLIARPRSGARLGHLSQPASGWLGCTAGRRGGAAARRNCKLIMRLAAKTAKSTKETAPRCAAGTPATGQTHHT